MKNKGCLLKGMVALLVLLMLGLAQSNPVMAARYKIYPGGDSYVDSQNPNTNYGFDTQLFAMYVADYLGSPLTQRSFLKFDLSGIPVDANITAAKLYLYVTSNMGHPPLNANLYHVGDDWTASGITWNNQPVAGAYWGPMSTCSGVSIMPGICLSQGSGIPSKTWQIAKYP